MAVYFLFFIMPISTKAQQLPQYSNYLFNNYGINPAFVNKGSCLEIRVGQRKQWIGFPNAPQTTFLSTNKIFGKKPFRNSWHGAGFYLEQDKQEFMKTEAFYPSYSFHLRVAEGYTASFGIFTGIKLISASNGLFDASDPAFTFSERVIVVPDLVTGARLYSKENFFDLSVRQIYKNKIQLGKKKIGTPSKLVPHINFMMGRRIESKAYYYSYLPSVNLKFAFFAPPAVDLSFMMFVKNQIGFGLSYRYNDAIIGMLQFKYKKLLTLALSYDYILSGIRLGASQSREIMLGFSSCPPGQDLSKATGCPAYDH